MNILGTGFSSASSYVSYMEDIEGNCVYDSNPVCTFSNFKILPGIYDVELYEDVAGDLIFLGSQTI